VRSSIIVNAREEVVFTIPFSCFLISLQDFSHGGLSARPPLFEFYV
jgi:hypothetical protein